MTDNIKSRFLRDIAKHEMTILHDHGVYRHIRFQSPRDNCYWFELVTWPGCLSICGDMGTYVFSRTEDMFRFFRRDQLEINEGYWAEKVVSSYRSGMKQFRVEAVRQWFRDNLRVCLEGWDKGDRKRIIGQVRELFDGIDEMSEEEVRREIDGINMDGDMVFSDMWEADFTEYTLHFLWCLYAIVWGIQQYDGAKVTEGAAS